MKKSYNSIGSEESLPKNLLCFSHLRWDFVFQRPQHLLTRFSQDLNVFFLEEPVFDTVESAFLEVDKKSNTLTVLRPHFKPGLNAEEVNTLLKSIVDNFLDKEDLQEWIFWYYTPMALSFSSHLKPYTVIFDCMDELSAFDFAPKELLDLEKKLLRISDLVFTGGHSLYEAKKHQHGNIFAFPSSIDKQHFASSRSIKTEPEDQAQVAGVKIGFFGVIDERFDLELIDHLALQRPDWQIILIGPVVKIDPASLPKHPNIKYMGQKSYKQLPEYLSGWDLALIPFKLNESTRFISPTKTPEYLAAGVPVVSTPIRDVINPYGLQGLVQVAGTKEEFLSAADTLLKVKKSSKWLAKVDAFLADKSWDNTYSQMKSKISQVQAQDKLLAS
jgi:glycosyltransferase involved in cell wall biosynthesis